MWHGNKSAYSFWTGLPLFSGYIFYLEATSLAKQILVSPKFYLKNY